jgi:hypothetical protein
LRPPLRDDCRHSTGVRQGEGQHGVHDLTTSVTDDDLIVTGKIALAHLNEFPDYYTRLKRMEAEAEAEHARLSLQGSQERRGRDPGRQRLTRPAIRVTTKICPISISRPDSIFPGWATGTRLP